MTAAPLALTLPGGVRAADGSLRRDAAFRPLTGRVEMEIADAREASLPARVSAALHAALERLGGAPASLESVRALCVDDRRFLMSRLVPLLGVRALWLTASCEACGRPFDVRVEPEALPVKPAGPGFPEGVVETATGRRRLRVPTGADQEAVAHLEPAAAPAALLARCVVEGEPPRDDDFSACEAAMEAVSPEVAREVSTACPACRAPARVPVDHYAGLHRTPETLEVDVHVLARGYGWSEDDVLALPSDRRRRYVARVLREFEAGVSGFLDSIAAEATGTAARPRIRLEPAGAEPASETAGGAPRAPSSSAAALREPEAPPEVAGSTASADTASSPSSGSPLAERPGARATAASAPPPIISRPGGREEPRSAAPRGDGGATPAQPLGAGSARPGAAVATGGARRPPAASGPEPPERRGEPAADRAASPDVRAEAPAASPRHRRGEPPVTAPSPTGGPASPDAGGEPPAARPSSPDVRGEPAARPSSPDGGEPPAARPSSPDVGDEPPAARPSPPDAHGDPPSPAGTSASRDGRGESPLDEPAGPAASPGVRAQAPMRASSPAARAPSLVGAPSLAAPAVRLGGGSEPPAPDARVASPGGAAEPPAGEFERLDGPVRRLGSARASGPAPLHIEQLDVIVASPPDATASRPAVAPLGALESRRYLRRL